MRLSIGGRGVAFGSLVSFYFWFGLVPICIIIGVCAHVFLFIFFVDGVFFPFPPLSPQPCPLDGAPIIPPPPSTLSSTGLPFPCETSEQWPCADDPTFLAFGVFSCDEALSICTTDSLTQAACLVRRSAARLLSSTTSSSPPSSNPCFPFPPRLRGYRCTEQLRDVPAMRGARAHRPSGAHRPSRRAQ